MCVKDYEMLTSSCYETSESIEGKMKWCHCEKREERYSIDRFISFCLSVMHTISADQTMEAGEADMEFNIFAVQLWYKGLIQRWILWLAHKSWGSVFKNLCCFQPPVWVSSSHSDHSFARMISYVTSAGENIERISQLLQNKLCRGVTILVLWYQSWMMQSSMDCD